MALAASNAIINSALLEISLTSGRVAQPVSYTHLDVYKRQVLGFGVGRVHSFLVHFAVGVRSGDLNQDMANRDGLGDAIVCLLYTSRCV